MLKKPRLIVLIIIVLTLLSLYVDLPKFKIFGQYFTHPKFITNVIKRDLEPKLGLDLAGGVELTMSADMSNIDFASRDDALESAKNIVENRINAYGVSEPVIQTGKKGGQYRLIVEMPGVSNADEVVTALKKVAFLEFKTLPKDFSKEATAEISPDVFISTGLTGNDLRRATASPSQDTQTPGYVVNLEFNSEGAKKFEEITKNNLDAPVAIFIDGELKQAPRVQSVISDGKAIITGNFDSKQAKEIAIELNSGALKTPLKIESQSRVGPTIGQSSIQKSIFATVVGLTSVAIFMIFYYRVLGLFAIAALFIYTLLVFAIFKLLPVTLTLAGIAGFVLSIGMAVDANILIFERIKEELRWGKPKLEAFFAGFERAWSSIRDSNVSSLITTAILFNFGTGSIRGFALTLAIGILVSMFSAITVTRTFLRVFWIRKY